jgi:hypothetical protein
VTKSRGRHCGDIELAAYFANAGGPVPLVLHLRIAHDRFGSSSDPSLNGHLNLLMIWINHSMRLPLTRSESTELTTIINPRLRSPL